MPKLLQHRQKVEVAPSFQNRRAIDIFRHMSFSDMVDDGMLVEVARYLRGLRTFESRLIGELCCQQSSSGRLASF